MIFTCTICSDHIFACKNDLTTLNFRQDLGYNNSDFRTMEFLVDIWFSNDLPTTQDGVNLNIMKYELMTVFFPLIGTRIFSITNTKRVCNFLFIRTCPWYHAHLNIWLWCWLHDPCWTTKWKSHFQLCFRILWVFFSILITKLKWKGFEFEIKDLTHIKIS